MKVIDIIARILVLIGALNWGSVGFFRFNVVDFFFGNMVAERIIYDLIGLAAIYLIIRIKKICGPCSTKR